MTNETIKKSLSYSRKKNLYFAKFLRVKNMYILMKISMSGRCEFIV